VLGQREELRAEGVETHQGTEVTVERPGGGLPLPPVNLLRDLQRARFGRPGDPPEPGVTVTTDELGSVRIRHAACGYETTLVTVKEAAPSAP